MPSKKTRRRRKSKSSIPTFPPAHLRRQTKRKYVYEGKAKKTKGGLTKSNILKRTRTRKGKTTTRYVTQKEINRGKRLMNWMLANKPDVIKKQQRLMKERKGKFNRGRR